MSGTHIDSLNNLFKVGQEIQVVILDIDEYKNRLSLSTKILEEYPGEIVEKLAEVMENAEARMPQVKEKLAN